MDGRLIPRLSAVTAAAALLLIASVTPAGAADKATDCKKGGWREVATAGGDAFRNQGQCVAYVVRGGSLTQACTYQMQPGVWWWSEVLAGEVLCGTSGDDNVGAKVYGVVLGGDGVDQVYELEDGGRFYGGPGNDKVDALAGGTFYGGPGDDWVNEMYDGSFDGGPDDDEVYWRASGTCISVETVVNGGPCPAP